MSAPLRQALDRSLAGAGIGTAVRRVVPGHSSPRAVSLTYDDGPDARWTPHVLSALAAADARATFFVLLSRVRTQPGLVLETMQAGHEIALHGPDHQDLRNFTPGEVYRRTRDARRELEDVVQRPVELYRPPYMSVGAAGWAALRRLGLTVVGHDTSAQDWVRDLSDGKRLAAWQEEVGPGSITLAHDAWPGPVDGVRARSEPEVDRGPLARSMCAHLADLGCRGVSVSDLLDSGTPEQAFVVSLRVTHFPPYLRRLRGGQGS